MMKPNDHSIVPDSARNTMLIGQDSRPRRSKKYQTLLISGAIALLLGAATAYFICSVRTDRRISELRQLSDQVMRDAMESGRGSGLSGY